MVPTFKDFAKEVGAWSFVAAEATLQELIETLLVDEELERHPANVSLKKLSNSQDEDTNDVILKPDPSSRIMRLPPAGPIHVFSSSP